VTGTKSLGLGARSDEIAECNGRQIRPQDAQFLEFLVGAPLYQQRNVIADSAALEPRIRVLHYCADVIVRKSCVLASEATLDLADKNPLFLRHSDIVALILTAVKTPGVNDLLGKSMEKNTFAPTGLRVWCGEGPRIGP
jgi:hypothetical protein